MKAKKDTPKYGLIYHASLIGQAPPKIKGKIARMLAAKCSLATRIDALGDSGDSTAGLQAREKVELRLLSLDGPGKSSKGGDGVMQGKRPLEHTPRGGKDKKMRA